MTPRSVIDAGKAERDRYSKPRRLLDKHWIVAETGKPLFTFVSRQSAQDFIDDRVFRAMLRAQLVEIARAFNRDETTTLSLGQYLYEQLEKIGDTDD